MSRRIWLAALLLLLAACARSDPAPNADPVTRLVLRVAENGLYAVSAADLQPFGWELAQLEAAQIRLSRENRPVSYHLAGEGEARELRFYGQITPRRYADTALYALELDGGGSTVEAREATPNTIELAQTGGDSIRVEPDNTYLAQVRDGDPWLGDRIFAPGQITLPLNLSHPTATATLTVALWAATEAAADPDHHLVFTLNDQQIGDVSWDGKGDHETTLNLPPGLLREGENNLKITAPGDTEARAELAYLNWIEINYQRLLIAQNDRIRFSGDAPGYTISGFSAPDIEIWDITAAEAPVPLLDFQVEKVGGNFTAHFSGGPGRFEAAGIASHLRPAIFPAPAPFTPPAAGADYIIITHPSLLAETQPLVEYRQSQGLRTAVVSTEQIFDRFSGGVPTPDAITAFLRWAVSDWPAPAPRFVLLAGDASYDPLDHLGGPYKNLVPTGLRPTIEMGETASDTALADLDADGLPDLALGRLPAQTPAQLRAMIAKTLAYERDQPTGDWQRHMLFLADDDDAYFASFNTDMAAFIPPEFATQQLVIGENDHVRADLLAALNAGQGLVSYMGHGAIDIWAQEEVLTAADIAELDQEGRLPFVVVWACLSGYFHHPQIESLGETLLLTPGNGAVAALVPTGQTFPFDQRLMADALFDRHLFSAETVGEALLASFRELDPASPGQADIINTFLLLGDPALRLFGTE